MDFIALVYAATLRPILGLVSFRFPRPFRLGLFATLPPALDTLSWELFFSFRFVFRTSLFLVADAVSCDFWTPLELGLPAILLPELNTLSWEFLKFDRRRLVEVWDSVAEGLFSKGLLVVFFDVCLSGTTLELCTLKELVDDAGGGLAFSRDLPVIFASDFLMRKDRLKVFTFVSSVLACSDFSPVSARKFAWIFSTVDLSF